MTGIEVFGASITIKDNITSTMNRARQSTRELRSDIDRTRNNINGLTNGRHTVRVSSNTRQAENGVTSLRSRIQAIRDRIVQVRARTEESQEKIKKLKELLRNIKDKTVHVAVGGLKNIGKALGKTALIGTAAAFTTVAAAGAAAVTKAVNFEAQMKTVGTLLDGNVNEKLKDMGSSLKQVSLDTGVATDNLADGLYQVVSAFGESKESVKQLEIAAKAAKAGGATTTDAVNLLSAVTKGYGDTSAEAMQKASDLAFLTVKLGQTSFPELASSMGQVIPLASTLKVRQEELFGAMSTLTGVTGGTSEVTTQLKATLQGFLSPSTEMAKALKKIGYETGAAALESDSLGGILNKLKESVNGDSVAFANLFSSVEAKNAVLALTGEQAENFASKAAQMEKAAGAADNAFQVQTSSVKEMGAKLKNTASIMLLELGEKTLPYLTQAVEKLSEKLPLIESAFSAVGEKVGPVIEMIVSKGVQLYKSWKPSLEQIGATFQTTWEKISPFFTNIASNLDKLLPTIAPLAASLVGVVMSALPVLMPILDGVVGAVTEIFSVLSPIISEIGEKISAAFSAIGERAGYLKAIFDTVGPAIAEVLSTAWSVAGPIIDVVLSQMDLILSGVDLLAAGIEKAFPVIQSVIEKVWSVIKPIIEGLGNGLETASKAVSGVSGFVGGIADKIRGKKKTEAGGGERIGANATGTNFWRGGYTMVGEHGPELLNLPTGAKVLSNSNTENLTQQKSSSIHINIANMEVRQEEDIDRIATQLAAKIQEAAENMD